MKFVGCRHKALSFRFCDEPQLFSSKQLGMSVVYTKASPQTWGLAFIINLQPYVASLLLVTT